VAEPIDVPPKPPAAVAEPTDAPPEQPAGWDELVARVAADPDWFAKYVMAEYARGNPYPLIGRVHGYPISNAEIAAISRALQAAAGKQTLRDLRDLEKKLIAVAVDRMMDVDEDKLTQTQAIDAMIRTTGRSLRYIKDAIKTYGKPRYTRREPKVQKTF
jgi:hypothetical protein